MNHIKISPNGSRGYSVKVDGHEISESVSSLTIGMAANNTPRVTLHLIPASVDLDLPDAHVTRHSSQAG